MCDRSTQHFTYANFFCSLNCHVRNQAIKAQTGNENGNSGKYFIQE